MKVRLVINFHTDGDFCFEDIDKIFNPTSSMYKGADVKYYYDKDGEEINIDLYAEGEENPCQWAIRDLLEGLMCSFRTNKYYLIEDMYNFLIPPKEQLLWLKTKKDIQHHDTISGNYDGTYMFLTIEPDKEE